MLKAYPKTSGISTFHEAYMRFGIGFYIPKKPKTVL